MAADPARLDSLEVLSPEELDAVIGAATWYAKRHAAMIADLADDPSAMAVSTRDRYQTLHTGLSKLGVRLRRPPGIRAA